MTEFAGIAAACCLGAVIGTMSGSYLYHRLDLWRAKREADALMAEYERIFRSLRAQPAVKGGLN